MPSRHSLMNPPQAADVRLTRQLRRCLRQHLEAVITEPRESTSRMWEVSFPRSTGTMYFSNPRTMLRALQILTRKPA